MLQVIACDVKQRSGLNTWFHRCGRPGWRPWTTNRDGDRVRRLYGAESTAVVPVTDTNRFVALCQLTRSVRTHDFADSCGKGPSSIPVGSTPVPLLPLTFPQELTRRISPLRSRWCVKMKLTWRARLINPQLAVGACVASAASAFPVQASSAV